MVKNKVKIWHNDHDTYHYEWRGDCWKDCKLGIPTEENRNLLKILNSLNPRGALYKLLCRFIVFESTPEFGMN